MNKIELLLLITVTICFVIVLFIMLYKEYTKSCEKIILFGIKIDLDDYFSFINGIISYLMIDDEVVLTDFIKMDLLKDAKSTDFIFIERTINLYPIIACRYNGNYKYTIDKDKLSKKYEKYQKETGKDDYIIPLFDTKLVSNNRNLFNVETQHQHFLNMIKLLNDDIISYRITK